MYGKDVKVRFRPSYFPFTEPSAEMDVTCFTAARLRMAPSMLYLRRDALEGRNPPCPMRVAVKVFVVADVGPGLGKYA